MFHLRERSVLPSDKVNVGAKPAKSRQPANEQSVFNQLGVYCYVWHYDNYKPDIAYYSVIYQKI